MLINARKPEGELGDKLLDRMNESHESLAQWGVSHLDIAADDIILDIGCGGGVNVERFLEMTENKVYGLDYSQIAVDKSKKLNQNAIDEGRCEIIQGSVSQLPFEDNSFDIDKEVDNIDNYFLKSYIKYLLINDPKSDYISSTKNISENVVRAEKKLTKRFKQIENAEIRAWRNSRKRFYN